MGFKVRFPSALRARGLIGASRAGIPASRALACGGTVLALALATGCGSEETPAEGAPREGEVVDISGTEAVGENTAGSVAQLVECRDWNGANAEQRLATIEDVRSQQNRQDPGLHEIELTDEEAGDLFDHACEPNYAQGFRLYKLYARANGFLSLKRALDG